MPFFLFSRLNRLRSASFPRPFGTTIPFFSRSRLNRFRSAAANRFRSASDNLLDAFELLEAFEFLEFLPDFLGEYLVLGFLIGFWGEFFNGRLAGAGGAGAHC